MKNTSNLIKASLILVATIALTAFTYVSTNEISPTEFQANSSTSTELLADNHLDLADKCGEGKCGEGKEKGEKSEKAEKSEKSKKGEKAEKGEGEAKCGEGKCGEGKAKEGESEKSEKKEEGKCGEGKCGGQ